MGCCRKLRLLFLVVTVFGIAYIYQKLTRVPDMPKLELDKWWGAGRAKIIDTSIRPFNVQFSDEMIIDLRARLSKAPSFAPLEGVAFEYGFNNNYLQEIIKFWANDYNFKEQEIFLNQYPQFKTNIQGLDIHYIHVKPTMATNVKVVPILLLHGWPGSVREFYETIPMLTSSRKEHDFVFEVIVPSLPGYGFSQAPAKPGMGPDNIAVVLRNLMQRLGYHKYYVQGGDLGSIIAMNMATFFPEEVLLGHISLPVYITPLSALLTLVGSVFPSLIVEKKYQERMYPLLEVILRWVEETGYLHIQATKPDTVGIALLDSPAGLAAYTLEKFSWGTNKDFKKLPDGGLPRAFKLVNLLDNVMIYWLSGSIVTSLRLYSESFNKRYFGLNMDMIPITAPTALVNFRHELIYQPELIVRMKFKNLVHFSHYDEGGHFGAFELPQVLSDDVWTAVSKARRAEKTENGDKNEL